MPLQIKGTKDSWNIYVNGKLVKPSLKLCSSRIIYRYKGWIIKINDDEYDDQSEFEFDIWKTLSPKHKRYFAKIVQYGHIRSNHFMYRRTYVVQKFIRGKHPRGISRIMTRAEKIGALYNVADIWADNVIQISKTGFKIVDYGYSA